MPPKRKGEGHPEEPQAKHHHVEGVVLPEEIIVEIISFLPLPQIFSPHLVEKHEQRTERSYSNLVETFGETTLEEGTPQQQ